MAALSRAAARAANRGALAEGECVPQHRAPRGVASRHSASSGFRVSADGTLEVPTPAMPSRARLTGNLAVGLVNVPIRLYAATRTEGIACHLLHDRRGSRIQDYYNPTVPFPTWRWPERSVSAVSRPPKTGMSASPRRAGMGPRWPSYCCCRPRWRRRGDAARSSRTNTCGFIRVSVRVAHATPPSPSAPPRGSRTPPAVQQR
jgi:hypothetical protein